MCTQSKLPSIHCLVPTHGAEADYDAQHMLRRDARCAPSECCYSSDNSVMLKSAMRYALDWRRCEAAGRYCASLAAQHPTRRTAHDQYVDDDNMNTYESTTTSSSFRSCSPRETTYSIEVEALARRAKSMLITQSSGSDETSSSSKLVGLPRTRRSLNLQHLLIVENTRSTSLTRIHPTAADCMYNT